VRALRPLRAADPPLPRLLTVEETALVLGTTPAGVRCRISRGQLPFVKVGRRRVRVPEDALREFISRLPGVTADEALATVAARRRPR
jgi:excisionase family DNA binding protein